MKLKTKLALNVENSFFVHIRACKIDQMDAVTTFLQGDLNKEIYIEQPEVFSDGTKRVGKLNRAMYGLKQAGRKSQAD